MMLPITTGGTIPIKPIVIGEKDIKSRIAPAGSRVNRDMQPVAATTPALIE